MTTARTILGQRIYIDGRDEWWTIIQWKQSTDGTRSGTVATHDKENEYGEIFTQWGVVMVNQPGHVCPEAFITLADFDDADQKLSKFLS